MTVCPSCGQETPEGFAYCGNCGAALITAEAAREERKVVSVLFADLVGFTSKAERLDPEDVRATLSPYYARLREELERHGGTVEKFIGDAVMAVFGAPVAHEDDPERAVRAALAIREAMAEDGRLQVRIAVTTGEALVSLGARAGEGEGMAAGDVVNTAARLQSAAPVNGILVDETTYRATRDRIAYDEADPVTAKGKTDPVRVWEATEARSRPGIDVIQTGATLVGRASELELLTGALARARDERSPQLVTLVGVPGIGKSRLVYELSQAVEADPDLLYWRQGRSLPYGEGITYWALAEMAKAQAGILETDTSEVAGRKLADAIAMLELDDEERLLGSLRPLVGLAAEGESGDRSELFAAWRTFFEGLAEQRPTVLVFEDLHWADDDLLDFVDHLADWSTGVPLLLVCTARPELLERRAGWGGGKTNALTLSISPLSNDDTARLLAGLLERAVLPAELQASLLARAGGNPLYAEQFARLLAETDGEDLTLPENVQGIIAARLDGLPAEEKQLLQDAAVLGKVFWLGAVCSIGDREPQDAAGRLHGLARKEFVRRERRSSVAGEDEYAFRHVLVRDVAYSQIPRGSRAERHERAAAWIDALGRPEDHAEMLAHHYLQALDLRRAAGQAESDELVEKTRLAARHAGDRAFALGAYAAAGRFYESALELHPRDDPERPELLLAYARSRVDDVALDDSVLEDATDGLLQAGNPEAAAEAQARLGGVWLNRGDGDRSLLHLERGRELVAERGPSPEKAFVLQELARALMMADDFDRAIEVASESLQLAEALGLEPVRARDLNTIGVSRAVVGDRGGLEDLERAIAIGGAVNSHEEVSALANLTYVTAVLGDLRRAAEMNEQTRSLAEQRGLSAFVRWQTAEHAGYCYLLGQWDKALAVADGFLRETEASSPHYQGAGCRCIRALIWLARGDVEAAVAEVRSGVELARNVKDPQLLNPTLAVAARVALASGDRAGASALADELCEAWRTVVIRQPDECSAAPWVFKDLSRAAELEAVLERTGTGTPWQEAAALVASGDLAAAADLYAEIGSVPDEAYTRLRTANDLVREGLRAEADAQLQLARPLFARLKASAWHAEAEALLARSA
jgi:class 3 adenylate cyclase/tetratricopeptide (TPR) repeat protein